MSIALIQIMRNADGGWLWMVEYDNPTLGQSGEAESYAAADTAVRDIVEGGK